jgi:hypothetical protein
MLAWMMKAAGALIGLPRELRTRHNMPPIRSHVESDKSAAGPAALAAFAAQEAIPEIGDIGGFASKRPGEGMRSPALDELVPSRFALRVGEIDVLVISDGVVTPVCTKNLIR